MTYSNPSNMRPMFSLPVHWSLPRVDALAHVLEEAYGLSQVRCQLIKATINDTYQIWASEGRFVLRISRTHERSADNITSELDAMTAVAGDVVQVAAVVPLRTGERLLPIQAPEGVRYGVLFPFIEGVQLSKASPIEHIVLVKVERALPLISPAYDQGKTEEEIRERWLGYWETLYHPS